MIKVAMGQAEGFDTLQTIKAVLSKCDHQLRDTQPQAGVVFAANHFDHLKMLDEINRRYPQLELIGCTTSGEFSSNHCAFSETTFIF